VQTNKVINKFFELPTNPGNYALYLHLEQQKEILIGRLGDKLFPCGEYIYLGSAHGPGGLRSRLYRHLSTYPEKRKHWHIDYLRPFCKIRSIFYIPDELIKAQIIPVECIWSQTLLQSLHDYVSIKLFGASDCKSGCPTHLVSFPKIERGDENHFIDKIRQNLALALGMDASSIHYRRFEIE
jgi:Uri superfamily endonuclease